MLMPGTSFTCSVTLTGVWAGSCPNKPHINIHKELTGAVEGGWSGAD